MTPLGRGRALFFAVQALLVAVCAAVDGKHAAKLVMVEELKRSPLDRDAYTHIPKSQRHYWEHDDGRTINETLHGFTDIPVDVVVAIKLIGFDGDGINKAKVNEAELLRYLRGLHLDAAGLGTPVAEPEPYYLSVRPRLHFRVSKAPLALTHRLASVLTTAVFAGKQALGHVPHSTLYLPHTLVDDVLVAEERQSQGQGHGHGAEVTHGSADSAAAAAVGSAAPRLTLYVLNLEPPAGTDYLYTYREDADVAAAGNWSEFRSCPGALFVSDQRLGPGGPGAGPGPGLAWVDLGAAPHAYGPLRGGQGQVFPHSLPHASSFQPELVSTALLPELAALAASSVRHLAWPHMQHATLMALPPPPPSGSAAGAGGGGGGRGGGADGTFVVQLVRIHDTLGQPPRSLRADVVQGELAAALSGSGLGVEVRTASLGFADCDLCVSAFNNALRVRTQRQEGSNVVAGSGHILDRLVLHRSMREYGEIIMAYAGVHETHGVLPVFVFELALREEPLLLDGALQAAAFPGMVLAVASRGGDAPRLHSRHSCGHAPRYLRPHNVTRAVLAGVLQAAFGVPHTAARQHPSSGPGWSHLWALGATPFGPLSGLTALSGPTAAAVTRNLALAQLHTQAGRVADVLRGLSRLSPRGSWQAAVARRDQRDRLMARLRLAELKRDLAVAALAAGRGGEALRYARLMGHDAAALERLARNLEAALVARLDCGGAGGAGWAPLLLPPAGSLLAVAAAVWWRGRGARMRAEARYDKIY